MCGLLGTLSFTSYPMALTEKAIGEIAHRGPDASNTLRVDNAFLHHCRLGFRGNDVAYPLPNALKNLFLGLNGEIYNYKELAKQIGLPQDLVSKLGDGYVVLSLFERYGYDSFSMLDGHFSFYIYDARDKTLILVRDRFGTKPIYYAKFNDTLVFSSETKAILELMNRSPKVNLQALDIYLRTQNFLGDSTLFDEIRLVEQGTFMVFRTGFQSTHKYFSYSQRNKLHGNKSIGYNDFVESVHNELVKSIKSQYEENHNLGVYLSGGLDSGLISVLLSQLNIPFQNYSIGVEDASMNELDEARGLSSALNVTNHSFIFSEDTFWEMLPKLPRVVEEPRFGQCAINYFVASKLSEGHRLAFSGVGADELFGGYPWRYSANDLGDNSKDSYVSQLVDKEHRLFSSGMGYKVTDHQPEDSISLIRNTIVSSLTEVPTTREDFVSSCLELDIRNWLSSILIVEDKISMSFGFETRLPFLSNNLLELGMTAPIDFLVSNESVGKLPLRKILVACQFPEIAERKKRGFSAPDAKWFRGKRYAELVFAKENHLWDLVDRSTCKNLYADHVSMRENYRSFLWSLLYLTTLLKSVDLH